MVSGKLKLTIQKPQRNLVRTTTTQEASKPRWTLPEPRDRETPTALSGGCTGPVVAVDNKPEEHSHSWGWEQGTMDAPPSQGEMQGLLSPMWAQLSGHTCQGMHVQGLVVFLPSSRQEGCRKRPLHAPAKPRGTLCELKASHFPILNHT